MTKLNDHEWAAIDKEIAELLKGLPGAHTMHTVLQKWKHASFDYDKRNEFDYKVVELLMAHPKLAMTLPKAYHAGGTPKRKHVWVATTPEGARNGINDPSAPVIEYHNVEVVEFAPDQYVTLTMP